MIEVRLTPLELKLVKHVAKQRDRDGQRAHADATKFGHGESTLQTHERGALGEIAFAKGINLYWSGAGEGYAHDSDVSGYHVRMARRPTYNGRPASLIVRPSERDDPNAVWVLVIRTGPRRCLIRGLDL